MQSKLDVVKDQLRKAGAAAIAFSGGTDSAFLLSVAKEVLGRKVLALIVKSALLPEEELDAAEEFCAATGVDYTVLAADPFRIEGFTDNPPDRCYLCKGELFSLIRQAAAKYGYTFVVDGTNADDANTYRPGLRALSELGIASPLKDAGLTKAEIRALAKERGLANWDKAAAPCLATRFPYGEQLTIEKTARVMAAESYLKELGFRELRVRSHGDLARIEVPRDAFEKLVVTGQAEEITAALLGLGFSYVTLDLQGLRSGSFDTALPTKM